MESCWRWIGSSRKRICSVQTFANTAKVGQWEYVLLRGGLYFLFWNNLMSLGLSVCCLFPPAGSVLLLGRSHFMAVLSLTSKIKPQFMFLLKCSLIWSRPVCCNERLNQLCSLQSPVITCRCSAASVFRSALDSCLFCLFLPPPPPFCPTCSEHCSRGDNNAACRGGS